MAKCNVCFRNCEIAEGAVGACLARGTVDGNVVPLNYGKITALALDPIEKKPLARFHPGSMILSVGSFGCNLRCPFCQNSSISYGPEVREGLLPARDISPEELVAIALEQRPNGNIGIAYTYNEPLVGWEYVRDCAVLAHRAGLVNVLVSNGSVTPDIQKKILPYIDAMNIDLKAFSDTFYSDLIHGRREMVMDFISQAAGHTHMEVTCLIIPDENDNRNEISALASWLHELELQHGCKIPLHITRFFPRFHMTDREATPVHTIFALAAAARKHLDYVYEGNV